MKKKTIFISLLFLLLHFNNVYAEKIVKNWDLQTGLKTIQDVERDKEGNIYVGGTDNTNYKVEKYNKNNELIWSKVINDYSAAISMTIDDEGNVYTVTLKPFLSWTDPVTNIIIDCNIAKSYIQKLDGNTGNVIFDKLIDEDTAKNVSPSQIKYNNNKIYILSANTENFRTDNYVGNSIEFVGDKKDSTYIFDKNGTQLKKIDLIIGDEYRMKYNILNGRISSCGGIWGLDKENNIVFDEDGVYYSILTYEKIFKYAKLNNNDELDWSKKIKDGEESFKYGMARDIALSENEILIGGTTGTEYIDKIDEISSWWVGEVPDYMRYETISYPTIVKTNKKGEIKDILKINNEDCYFRNIRNQDNGYYVLIYLSEPNVEDFKNEEKGYHLIRYDYDFNIKDVIKINNSPYLTSDLKEGVFILDGGTLIRYSLEQTEKKEISHKILISNKETNINSLFKNLNNSNIKWKVKDESIATIENGLIIPKKVGETIITGVYEREDYIINLQVEDDSIINKIINPPTSTNIKIVGISLLVITSIYIINKKKRVGE